MLNSRVFETKLQEEVEMLEIFKQGGVEKIRDRCFGLNYLVIQGEGLFHLIGSLVVDEFDDATVNSEVFFARLLLVVAAVEDLFGLTKQAVDDHQSHYLLAIEHAPLVLNFTEDLSCLRLLVQSNVIQDKQEINSDMLLTSLPHLLMVVQREAVIAEHVASLPRFKEQLQRIFMLLHLILKAKKAGFKEHLVAFNEALQVIIEIELPRLRTRVAQVIIDQFIDAYALLGLLIFGVLVIPQVQDRQNCHELGGIWRFSYVVHELKQLLMLSSGDQLASVDQVIRWRLNSEAHLETFSSTQLTELKGEDSYSFQEQRGEIRTCFILVCSLEIFYHIHGLFQFAHVVEALAVICCIGDVQGPDLGQQIIAAHSFLGREFPQQEQDQFLLLLLYILEEVDHFVNQRQFFGWRGWEEWLYLLDFVCIPPLLQPLEDLGYPVSLTGEEALIIQELCEMLDLLVVIALPLSIRAAPLRNEFAKPREPVLRQCVGIEEADYNLQGKELLDLLPAVLLLLLNHVNLVRPEQAKNSIILSKCTSKDIHQPMEPYKPQLEEKKASQSAQGGLPRSTNNHPQNLSEEEWQMHPNEPKLQNNLATRIHRKLTQNRLSRSYSADQVEIVYKCDEQVLICIQSMSSLQVAQQGLLFSLVQDQKEEERAVSRISALMNLQYESFMKSTPIRQMKRPRLEELCRSVKSEQDE